MIIKYLKILVINYTFFNIIIFFIFKYFNLIIIIIYHDFILNENFLILF